MTQRLSQSPAVRQAIARTLSMGYRSKCDARIFIAEALDEEMNRSGWHGALRVTRLCLKDILVLQVQPAGHQLTAAPLSTRGDARPHRSWLMDRLVQDLRFGFRQIKRQPGFALIAILTMALGVGANTAIFSVAWRTMLKPLPYPDSHQLVEVWETSRRNGSHNMSMPGKFLDLRAAQSFSRVAAYTGRGGSQDLTGHGDPVQLASRSVTEQYFDVFNMRALAGRVFTPADMTEDVAIISEALWRTRFGARANAVGESMRLGGRPFTIVGVMPEAFTEEGGRVDLWTTFPTPQESPRLAAHYLRVVARLAPGVTVEQANAEVRTIADRAAASFPNSDGQWTQEAISLVQARRSGPLSDGLSMLAMAAGVVLLVSCANLASLQLARGIARQREFGIRTALGASRLRVVMQLVTEGLVIAALGSIAGLVAGAWALQGLALVAPAELAVAARTPPDAAVIAYAVALSIISAVIFSLAPSWHAASNAIQWLRQRSEAADGRSAKLRVALVAAQIGAAVALLIGATLLISSLTRLLRVDPGFKADGALTFDASVPANIGTFAQQRALFDRIGASVAALPGVTAVCAINEIPMDAFGGMTYVPEGETRMVGALPRNIDAGCFDALGLTLRAGRAITSREQSRVAIVSESFARAAWPNGDPIGKRVHLGVPSGDLIEIVGVAADTQQMSLEARPFPQFYEAWTEPSAFTPSRFIVRASGSLPALFDPIRAAVRRADPDQTVARLRTLTQVIDQSVAARQFNLRLLGSFSAIALMLAAIGVYGLLAQVVAQRRPEIGLRLALGATPHSVVMLVLRTAVVALAIGLPAGIGVAIFSARLLKQFMFRTSATDPWTHVGVAAALAAVVIGAAWLPARRAARIDPAVTLK